MNKSIYVYIVPTCQGFSIQPVASWNYHVDEEFMQQTSCDGWSGWITGQFIYSLFTQPHWFLLINKALFNPYFWAVYVRGGVG